MHSISLNVPDCYCGALYNVVERYKFNNKQTFGHIFEDWMYYNSTFKAGPLNPQLVSKVLLATQCYVACWDIFVIRKKCFNPFRGTGETKRQKTIIIFLHGLGRLTCSGIDALPSFPGASTISSSSRFIVEGVFRESAVVRSFKVVDPVLFVCESRVLYSRDL